MKKKIAISFGVILLITTLVIPFSSIVKAGEATDIDLASLLSSHELKFSRIGQMLLFQKDMCFMD